MLVRAFQIHYSVTAAFAHSLDTSEAGKILRIFQCERMGRAGIEPDIEHIVDLVEILRIVIRREKTRGGIRRKPGVRAFFLERLSDPGVDPRIDENVARLLADENRYRHAPGALARDDPIRPPATMPVMRFSPCAGNHCVRAISSSAISRSDGPPLLPCVLPAETFMGLSIAMNHCGVLRKMSGFFERQECGY